MRARARPGDIDPDDDLGNDAAAHDGPESVRAGHVFAGRGRADRAPTVGPDRAAADVPAVTPGEVPTARPPAVDDESRVAGGTPGVDMTGVTRLADRIRRLPRSTPGVRATTPTPTPRAPGSGGIERQKITVTSSVLFDAARDLTAFRFSDRPGFVLNPRLAAFDLDKVGNIQAQLGLSSVAPNPDTGRPDVEVTAERVDEELGRRVEVASAPVRADGSFALYPLPLDEQADGPTKYDLVIHGPAVTTLIIRGVPVTEGAPDAGADAAAFDTIALLASETYRVNLETGSAVAPRGARVRFYQTLADDDVPFLIDERPVDPLTGRFAKDEPLSAAPVVVYGTFDTSFAVVAAAPTEGAARYSVAAFAPLYGSGDSRERRSRRPRRREARPHSTSPRFQYLRAPPRARSRRTSPPQPRASTTTARYS